ADTPSLLRELVRRGWLTAEQADLLAQGRGLELAPKATLVTPQEPQVLEYARPWKLALILGGVAVLVLLIAILSRPRDKPRGEPPEHPGEVEKTPSAAWPEDLPRLPGVTEMQRTGPARFAG